MKLKSKKGWKSIVPLHLKGKSATRFSLFRKVNSASYGPAKAPVYLNVYDLTPMNGYMYWAGLGIYHSGVEGKLTGFDLLNFDLTLVVPCLNYFMTVEGYISRVCYE